MYTMIEFLAFIFFFFLKIILLWLFDLFSYSAKRGKCGTSKIRTRLSSSFSLAATKLKSFQESFHIQEFICIAITHAGAFSMHSIQKYPWLDQFPIVAIITKHRRQSWQRVTKRKRTKPKGDELKMIKVRKKRRRRRRRRRRKERLARKPENRESESFGEFPRNIFVLLLRLKFQPPQTTRKMAIMATRASNRMKNWLLWFMTGGGEKDVVDICRGVLVFVWFVDVGWWARFPWDDDDRRVTTMERLVAMSTARVWKHHLSERWASPLRCIFAPFNELSPTGIQLKVTLYQNQKEPGGESELMFPAAGSPTAPPVLSAWKKVVPGWSEEELIQEAGFSVTALGYKRQPALV